MIPLLIFPHFWLLHSLRWISKYVFYDILYYYCCFECCQHLQVLGSWFRTFWLLFIETLNSIWGFLFLSTLFKFLLYCENQLIMKSILMPFFAPSHYAENFCVPQNLLGLTLPFLDMLILVCSIFSISYNTVKPA